MTRHSPGRYLFDIVAAADWVQQATQEVEFESFDRDLTLRFAVERQLIVVGEAVAQFAKVAPDLAVRLGDIRGVISFRNVLVHAYDIVDPEAAWRIVRERLPELRDCAAAMLGDIEG